MTTRIYPSVEEIKNLIEPLPNQLLELVIFLNDNLDPDWEIFIQPFLNSERPSLVILHKKIGVLFIEYFAENGSNLKAEINITKSEKGSFKRRKILKNINGKFKEIYNPVEYVESLCQNLATIYVSDITHAARKDPEALRVVKKALYIPNISLEEAKRIFSNEIQDLFFINKDHFNKTKLKEFIPSLSKDQKFVLQQEWYEKLLFWFNPPFHKKEHGIKISLNTQQRRYSIHTPDKFQRFKGVAGSGKTLVLAQRAASIAATQKKVLILTYNVTLINYIFEFLGRSYIDFDFHYITVMNYHHFCSVYFHENHTKWPRDHNKSIMFNKIVPEKLIDLISNNYNNRNRSYDAIIIDEGQDFEPIWLDSVVLLLSPNGELLLAADDNQDIYGKGTANLEKIKKGFSGPWGNLEQTYRIPLKILNELNRFIDLHLDGQGRITKHSKDSLFDTWLYWNNVSESDDFTDLIYNTYQYLIQKRYVHKEDIVILVPNFKIGKKVSDKFRSLDIEVVEIFGDREKKISFRYDDWRLKICTFQSFKGWEYHSIVLLIPDDNYKSTNNINKLIYTGLTRSMNNLVVLNGHSKYNSFPDYKIWEKIPIK